MNTAVSDAPPTYQAVAMQLTARSVQAAPDKDAARAGVLKHIDDIFPQIIGAKAFIEQYGGEPVKLVVLPEYLFQSYPVRIGIADFADLAAFAPDGPEYEAIGKLAERLGVYLSGNVYESDGSFPGFYFQASFVAAPSGEIVLRYRRLNSMFAPTPHDVWTKYLDILRPRRRLSRREYRYRPSSVHCFRRNPLSRNRPRPRAARRGNLPAFLFGGRRSARHPQGHRQARPRPREHRLCRQRQHGRDQRRVAAARQRRRQ